MQLVDDLLAALPDGDVLDVCIGLHWTAVVIRSDGQVRCGLASTVTGPHNHSANPDVPQAGQLHALSARELARLAHSEQPPWRASVWRRSMPFCRLNQIAGMM